MVCCGCCFVDVVLTAATEAVVAFVSSSHAVRAVAAYPPPVYQWYCQGTAVTGQNTAVLRVESFSRRHVGTYHCIAENALGKRQSRTVSVKFAKYGPEIKSQPQSRLMRVGDQYRLRVVAEGEPACQYQWFKDDVEIEGATGNELELDAIDGSITGQYCCTVTNMVGSVSSALAEVTLMLMPRSRALFGLPRSYPC